MRLVLDLDNAYKVNFSFMGANQEGKTTMVRDFVETLYYNGYNVVIYDYHWIFGDIDPTKIRKNLYDLKGRGLEIFQADINSQTIFDNFCSVVFNMNHVIVVNDELHNFCKAQRLPTPLGLLLQNSGNRNIGLISIFHTPSLVPKEVITTSNHLFCFYLDEPNAIKYMKKIVGSKVEAFNTGKIPKYGKIYKKRGEPALVLNADNEVIEV